MNLRLIDAQTDALRAKAEEQGRSMQEVDRAAYRRVRLRPFRTPPRGGRAGPDRGRRAPRAPVAVTASHPPVDHLSLEDLLGVAEGVLDGVAVRDLGLLESAAARPRSSAFGQDAYPTFVEKAASLMQSLARNHAQVDVNQRLAWAATRVFCLLNGHDVVFTSTTPRRWSSASPRVSWTRPRSPGCRARTSREETVPIRAQHPRAVPEHRTHRVHPRDLRLADRPVRRGPSAVAQCGLRRSGTRRDRRVFRGLDPVEPRAERPSGGVGGLNRGDERLVAPPHPVRSGVRRRGTTRDADPPDLGRHRRRHREAHERAGRAPVATRTCVG